MNWIWCQITLECEIVISKMLSAAHIFFFAFSDPHGLRLFGFHSWIAAILSLNCDCLSRWLRMTIQVLFYCFLFLRWSISLMSFIGDSLRRLAAQLFFSDAQRASETIVSPSLFPPFYHWPAKNPVFLDSKRCLRLQKFLQIFISRLLQLTSFFLGKRKTESRGTTTVNEKCTCSPGSQLEWNVAWQEQKTRSYLIYESHAQLID